MCKTILLGQPKTLFEAEQKTINFRIFKLKILVLRIRMGGQSSHRLKLCRIFIYRCMYIRLQDFVISRMA